MKDICDSKYVTNNISLFGEIIREIFQCDLKINIHVSENIIQVVFLINKKISLIIKKRKLNIFINKLALQLIESGFLLGCHEKEYATFQWNLEED